MEYNEVGPDYFPTIGIPLVSGREFTRSDDEKSVLVAIVNETMAAKYWRGRNPMGERVQVKGRWMQVVGVAKDSKYESVRETPKPFFYVPLRQNFAIGAGLNIRTRLSPEAVTAALTREVHAMDRNLALVRSNHAARTSGSLDVATTRGRNSSECIGRLGPVTRSDRIVWRDVLCGVAEHARTGLAYGSGRDSVPPAAAGDVAWPRVDGCRNCCGHGGGASVDAAAWIPALQRKPARPVIVRVGIRGHHDRVAGSMFLARLACDQNRSASGFTGLAIRTSFMDVPRPFAAKARRRRQIIYAAIGLALIARSDNGRIETQAGGAGCRPLGSLDRHGQARFHDSAGSRNRHAHSGGDSLDPNHHRWTRGQDPCAPGHAGKGGHGNRHPE